MAATGTAYVNPATNGLETVPKSVPMVENTKNKWLEHERRRERDLIRYGKQEGYLKIASVEDILAHSSKLQEENVESIDKVKIINLSSSKLASLGPLSVCSSLVICNLSNNFIKRIDSLVHATNLKKLDLHSNQITTLPDDSFWSEFNSLSILYLHDNGISDYQSLRNLSKAPQLSILTMHDTPLSLKQHYRHFVVNALWSLKALDNIIISDEEIIEDAKFTPRFSTLQRQFWFEPTSLHDEQRTLRDELNMIVADITEVNRRQSQFCPVLIMQKIIRGHLARQQYRYTQEQRLWAAVSIQRFYRNIKGFPNPPLSPIATTSHKEGEATSLSSIKLDYDSYLKMRRSKEKSVFSLGTNRTFPSDTTVSILKSAKSFNKPRPYSKSTAKLIARTTPTGVIIDAEGLRASIMQKISNSGNTRLPHALPPPKTAVKQQRQPSTELEGIDELVKGPPRDLVSSKRDRRKVGKYYSQYQFLGEVVTPDQSKETSNEDAADVDNVRSDEQEGNIDFRLSTQTPPCLKHDPIDELILRTAQSADDIRHSIRVIENYLANVPPKVAVRKPVMTADQRMFLRTHGTMSLSCFQAVDKAYRDREKNDQLHLKRKLVSRIHARDRKIVNRVQNYKEHYSAKAAMRSKKEKLLLENKLSEKSAETLQDLQDRVKKVQIKIEKGKAKHRDSAFVSDFNAQMGSIRAAVVNHERASRKDQLITSKSTVVEKMRQASEAQKQTISRFFEQRLEVKRAETALEKANIDAMLISQKDNYQSAAKDRVRRLREEESSSTLRSFVPHQASAPPRSPILGVISDLQIDNWEQQMPKPFEHRVHDRPIPM